MSEKTEQPTPKRLREAREKGQVCKSQEVCATAVLLAVFGIFLGAGVFIWETLLRIFEIPLRSLNQPFGAALSHASGEVFFLGLQIVGVVLGTAVCAGLAANLVQTGVLVSVKAALPKLDKLNPTQWFKKTFALKNLVELVKIIAKTLVMFLVVKIAI
ncbi:MAG: EscU/YscU/HrcU family type III secretion system export apparatus switch protein, partial [Deltaproteobacteria bacterium]|nr:EscU/YscU/HrcU family type III secretion system export apparatus switch protein [Deltaproteobacteria bacterium]